MTHPITETSIIGQAYCPYCQSEVLLASVDMQAELAEINTGTFIAHEVMSRTYTFRHHGHTWSGDGPYTVRKVTSIHVGTRR
jgi:hypothetical protein